MCLVERSKRARGSLRAKCRCLGGTNPASDLSMLTGQRTFSEASVDHDGQAADVISRSISEECKWLQPMTRGIYKTLRCLKTPNFSLCSPHQFLSMERIHSVHQVGSRNAKFLPGTGTTRVTRTLAGTEELGSGGRQAYDGISLSRSRCCD